MIGFLHAADAHHPARQAQNITSIADFIAARYGKSQAVAATGAGIAISARALYRAAAQGWRPRSRPFLNQDSDVSSIPYIGHIALIVTISSRVRGAVRHAPDDRHEHQHG